MRYYANYDESGQLLSIQAGGRGGLEIEPAEYARLESWISQMNEQAGKVFAGEITLEDVPLADRKEVTRRVAWLEKMEAAAQNADISADEALNIILGGYST